MQSCVKPYLLVKKRLSGAALCIEKTGCFLYNGFMTYKVVETSTVTDESIERILNEWTSKGFSFWSIHFVTSESSRRPAMAFLFFVEGDGFPEAGRGKGSIV